jgi:peptide/nickel transport system permease protein
MLNVVKETFSGCSKMTLSMIFSGAFISCMLIFVSIFAPVISPHDPFELEFEPLQPPNQDNLFGTDILGRDILSRVIYGGRTSLSVAIISVLFSLAVATTLGSTFTYIGGKLDKLMILIMDSLWVYPMYLVALVIVVLFGASFINLAIAVGIALIPSLYRVVRSLTLSLKEQTFIEAENSLGAGMGYIIYRHIIPYMIPTFVVLTSLDMAQAIIIASSLGFLGLGIPPPTPEWGTDLYSGIRVWLGGYWWCTFFPAFMIFLSVLGFNLLGEGLDAYLRKKGKP